MNLFDAIIRDYRTRIVNEICVSGFTKVKETLAEMVMAVVAIRLEDADKKMPKQTYSVYRELYRADIERICDDAGNQLVEDVIDNGFKSLRANLLHTVMLAGQAGLLPETKT
jgi:hypothetical protein